MGFSGGIFDGDSMRICWDFYRKNSCVFFMGTLWIFGRNFFERLCGTSVEKIGVIFFFCGIFDGDSTRICRDCYRKLLCDDFVGFL